MRYVIFDRDGTLIKHVPYLTDFRKIKFENKVFEGLKILKTHFRFGIISNQSVIGRGLAEHTDVKKINNVITEEYGKYGIFFDFFTYCPHNVIDDCNCRKPKIELFERAKVDFNIEPSKSYYIGDQESDVIFGLNCGLRPCIIDSAGSFPEKFNKDVIIEKNLYAICKKILKECDGSDY